MQLNGAGTATANAANANNGSSDACGIGGFSLSPATYGCANVGTNNAVLTVTDVNGNSSTCSAAVTVQDNVPPTATCQTVTVQLNGTGNGSTTAAAVNNGSADACGIQSLALSQTAFTCADLGPNTETLTVTDVNGNSSTCSATVTVQDNVAPVANCQNVTVQLDANGNGTASAAAANNGSADACNPGSLTYTLIPNTFTCANVGNVTSVLTVTDSQGNTSTCSTTISVQDNVAPVAVCQSITVQLNGAGQGTATAVSVGSGSTDACGVQTMTLSQTSFTCADVGTVNGVLSVTDVHGNTGTCGTAVTVQDLVPPVAACQNITVQVDVNGNATASPAAVNNGSADACGIQSLALSQSNFGCANIGPNTVGLVVTDNNGNTGTCLATVTVEDNQGPVANCQNVTVQLDANGVGSATAASVNNGSADACSGGNLTLGLVPSTFNCANVGTMPATLTVTDVQGNSSTCAAVITVADIIPPTAVCQNVTLNLDNTGNGTVTAAAIASASTDNCGVQGMTVSQSAFNCTDVGNNNVTVTITDVNGNTTTCVKGVLVQDVTPPTANCQAVTVQLNGNGSGTISASDVNNGSADACGIANATVTPTSFGCANVGTVPVTLTVTDANGNTGTCSSIATVQDLVPPLAVCQNVTVNLGPNGTGSVTASAVDGGSTDACGILSVDFGGTTTIGYGCTDVGGNPVFLLVTDVNGNSAICTSTVSVVDNTFPTLNCPANITLTSSSLLCGANATWTVPTASDNCGTSVASGSHTPGSFFAAGVTTVTYSTTDNNGNTTTCSFTVTVNVGQLVVDATAPTVGCGFNLACASDQNAVVSTLVTGGCEPYTYLWSTGATTPALTGVGAGSYTVTVTDNRGFTATDNIVITAPTPLTVSATGTPLLCQGSTSGTATAAGAGGQVCQPYTYNWSNGATTATVTGLAAGTYTVTVTDDLGCTATTAFTIQQGTTANADLGPDLTRCPGVPATFQPSGSFNTYQWSNGSTSPSILVSTPGTYSLTVTSVDGCVDADTVVLANFVVDNDIITPSGSLTLCPGQSVNLVGDAGLTGYTWSSGQTTQSITVTGQSGTFVLNASDTHGCAVSDTAVVVFHPWTDPNPVITPSPGTVICPGGSVTLDVGNFYTTYSWSNGATVQAVTVTSPGTYTVTVGNAFGCTMASNSVSVTQGTTPTPVIVMSSGVLSTTQPFATYQWVLNGNPIPGATTPTYTPAFPGTYSVIVTNSGGCEGTSNEILFDPTGVGETVEALQGLVLYPNPSRDIVKLRTLSPIDWPVKVEVWDMFGQQVRVFDMAHLMDMASFDLSDLAAAPYLMKITTFKQNKTQQAVIRFVLE